MPTNNIIHHDGWKLEMDSALDSSEYYNCPYDFLDGFLARESRNRSVECQRKTSKSCSAASGRSLDERKRLEISSKNKPNSGKDFLDGFSKRQRERDRFAQNDTKVLESSIVSGHEQDKRELRNSAENKPISRSGEDFLDGFCQHTKSETEPYGSYDVYKRELLNSGDQNIQSPCANYTQKSPIRPPCKPPSVPTQTSSQSTRNLSTKTSSSESYATSEDRLDEGKRLKYSTASSPPSSSTSESPLASTQASSASSHYFSTSNTNLESNPPSQRKFDGQEWSSKSSENQNHHVPYSRKPVTIQTPSPTTQNLSTTTTSRSKISEAEWQEQAKKSQQEQKEFLEKFFKEGKFRDEEVSSLKNNVSRGDHIVCQGFFGDLYDHHFLCTDVDGDRIYAIEYTGPSFGFAAASRLATSTEVLAFAAIKKGTLTFEELEKKKAKIRKWPQELQRFSVDEVIARAESRYRRKERDYHGFNNNCETFVNWCICGLSTSLQVEPWYQFAWDSAKGVGTAALEGLKRYSGFSEKHGIPAFLKAVGNVSDEVMGAISNPLTPVGFAVAAVIETGFAAWSITNDVERMKEGRLSKGQFKINSFSTVSKAVGHIAGGVTGSVIGSAFSPVGSLVGGGIGYGVGHVVGSAVASCYEYAPKIKKTFQDYVIAPVKEVVDTCVDAVNTAAKTVLEEVENVFLSLFSWWQ